MHADVKADQTNNWISGCPSSAFHLPPPSGVEGFMFQAAITAVSNDSLTSTLTERCIRQQFTWTLNQQMFF